MGKGSRQRRNREPFGRGPQKASSAATPAVAETAATAKPAEHRPVSNRPHTLSHISKSAPRIKRRQEKIATAAGKPKKLTPTHAVASAKVSNNKYALLELLDDEFEEVRQKCLTSKGREVAEATRAAEKKAARLRRPVSKDVFEATMVGLEKL